MMLSTISTYAQGDYTYYRIDNSNYNHCKWQNNMFGVQYDYFLEPKTFDSDYGKYHFHDNCMTLFGALYGVYMDLTLGVESNDKDFGGLHATGINIGYMIPLNTPEYGMPIFYITPLVGYSCLNYEEDNYNGAPPEAEYLNLGISLGMSINNIYLQTKITRCEFGIGIGYKY